MAEVLESRSSISEPPPPIVIAGYWVHAGETEKAFALLEAAYRQHDDGLLMLKDDRLDPIKQDPRYKDLVRRVGLPE